MRSSLGHVAEVYIEFGNWRDRTLNTANLCFQTQKEYYGDFTEVNNIGNDERGISVSNLERANEFPCANFSVLKNLDHFHSINKTTF